MRECNPTSVLIDYCGFGCRYRKRTRLITSLPCLQSIAHKCDGSHFHEHLQGTVRPGGSSPPVWKTSLAARYPPQLCWAWARALLAAALAGAVADDGADSFLARWRLDRPRLAAGAQPPSTLAPCCPLYHVDEWSVEDVQWEPPRGQGALATAGLPAPGVGEHPPPHAASGSGSAPHRHRRGLGERHLPPRASSSAAHSRNLPQGLCRVRLLGESMKLPVTQQADLDWTMTKYLHHLYFGGDSTYAGRVAVYGVAHIRMLNLRDPLELALSRQALRGFGVAASETQRDPICWEALALL